MGAVKSGIGKMATSGVSKLYKRFKTPNKNMLKSSKMGSLKGIRANYHGGRSGGF